MADSSTQTSPQVFRSNRGRNLKLVGEKEMIPPEMAEISSLKSQVAAYQAREAAVHAKEKDLKEIMATIRVALGILSARAATMIALFASIAAFGFAVAEPAALRITAACLFTVIVFLPALWADARRN